MEASRKTHVAWLIGLLLMLELNSACAATNYPAWWSNVIDTNAPNDFAPAAAGQLKWMATNAFLELESNLPGGAGPYVLQLVSGFSGSNNFFAVNLGQLKCASTSFYDRLIAVGYTNSYPWTTNTTLDDSDFGVANLGQLKNVFNFNVTSDADDDSLPDWWELLWFGNIATWTGTNDPDGDGRLNLAEYQTECNPTNWETALPYAVGFEANEGYASGPLGTQDHWKASSSGVVVQSETVALGLQAVTLKDRGAWMSRAFYAPNTIVTNKVRIYLSDVSAFPPGPGDVPQAASCLVSYDPLQGIMAYDGTGTGTWVLAADTLMPDQWVSLRIEQDYVNHLWSLSVNGTQTLSNLGFRNSAVDRLRNVIVSGGSAGRCCIDALRIGGN